MKDWSVYIQTAHTLDVTRVEEIAYELADLLRAHAGSVSYDGQMIAGRFDVRAADPKGALVKADRIFTLALRKAKFPSEPNLISAEVETVEALDRRLAKSNVPPVVGVKEVADALGVSKQRISELSHQRSFPHPLATLAAGPVWDRHAIARFLERWPRRRTGRPRKQTAQHATTFAERPGR